MFYFLEKGYKDHVPSEEALQYLENVTQKTNSIVYP
jgi:hypothetical protein